MPDILLHRHGEVIAQQRCGFCLGASIEASPIFGQPHDPQPIAGLVEGQAQTPSLAVAALFHLPSQKHVGARLHADEKGQTIEVGLIPSQDDVTQWAVVNPLQNLSRPTPFFVDELG